MDQGQGNELGQGPGARTAFPSQYVVKVMAIMGRALMDLFE